MGNEGYIGNINNENINKKLKRCNSEELKFFINDGVKEDILFVPLYSVEDEIYTVYMNVIKNEDIFNTFKRVNDGSEAYS